MITIIGPVAAKEYGGCNACTDNRNDDGTTKEGSEVYEIWFRRNNTGGISVRLCDLCAQVLYEKLEDS